MIVVAPGGASAVGPGQPGKPERHQADAFGDVRWVLNGRELALGHGTRG
jgi:hypothetical protein